MTASIRSHRETVILDATLAEIMTNGVENISMQKIAQRCGLTRTAIYQYFSSVEDVFAELVINDMADLVNQIEVHVASFDEPLEQVRVWIHYSLAHLSTGEHAQIRKLSERKMPESKRGLIRALHGQFMLALVSPVQQINEKNSESICSFIAATVNAAANRIEAGSLFEVEAHAVEEFVISALT
jgi:AcrR family transcriptional regulator